LFFF
jgi:hypothetical protein